MADNDLNLSPPLVTRTSPSPKKDDLRPVGAKITELNESQAELLSRLQGLKEDLQVWKSKLDNQVKNYKDELVDLKKALETDLGQLKSDFQELRTTLQQQQEDVTNSLRIFGLDDADDGSIEPKAKDKEQALDNLDASLLVNVAETSLADEAEKENPV